MIMRISEKYAPVRMRYTGINHGQRNVIWHLAPHPDELAVMNDDVLRNAAPVIDS